MTKGKWYITKGEVKGERRTASNGQVSFQAVIIPAGQRVKYIRSYGDEVMVAVNGQTIFAQGL